MINNITMKNNMDHLIQAALREDISSEDISTNSVIKEPRRASAQLLCKEDGIIAGLDVFRRVFHLLDADTTADACVKDGDRITKGQLIATVTGEPSCQVKGPPSTSSSA